MSTDDLRASDQDRDRTAEVVRQAASEGRLDLEEMEHRLDQVFAAKTYRDLLAVTRDLPNAQGDQPGTPQRTHLPEQAPAEISAIFSNERWRGEWVVPPRMHLRSICGDLKLDFTEAILRHEVELDVHIVLGQATLYVPDDIAVVFERGSTVLGSRENKSRGEPRPGTPLIRVGGSVLCGELVARPPKRRFGRRR